MAVSPSGGRPTVLLEITQSDLGKLSPDTDVIIPGDARGMAWSPDSRSIAMDVRIARGSYANLQSGILLVNRNGSRRGLISLPDGAMACGTLFWSPNGRKLAARVMYPGQTPQEKVSVIKTVIFDTVADNALIALDLPEGVHDVEKWSEDGKSLVCRMLKDKILSRIEFPLSGGPIRVLDEKANSDRLSPDGAFRLVQGKPGITIERISTKEQIPLIRKPDSSLINWSPDNRLFSFWRSGEVKDDLDSRKESLTQLWVGVTQAGKYNHIYISTLESGRNGGAEVDWSADGCALAYVSDNHLYTVKLIARPPDMSEKRDLGIPLTEDEMALALFGNSKQIYLGITFYTQANGGRMPGEGTLEQDIYPYTMNHDILRNPNGGADLFEYFPVPDLHGLADRASAVIGRMDAGYGWVTELYADGHAKNVPRDQ